MQRQWPALGKIKTNFCMLINVYEKHLHGFMDSFHYVCVPHLTLRYKMNYIWRKKVQFPTCTYTIVASFENDMILSTVTKKSLTTSIPFVSLKV